jgi:hypothetical protein
LFDELTVRTAALIGVPPFDPENVQREISSILTGRATD